MQTWPQRHSYNVEEKTTHSVPRVRGSHLIAAVIFIYFGCEELIETRVRRIHIIVSSIFFTFSKVFHIAKLFFSKSG